MNDAIAKRFVATYYRLLFRYPDLVQRLYLPTAEIVRIREGQTYRGLIGQNINIFPYDLNSTVTKINSFHSMSSIDYIVINVFGSFSSIGNETKFSQQFVMVQVKSKWMISTDTYFEFSIPLSDLVCSSGDESLMNSVPPPSIKKWAPSKVPTSTTLSQDSKAPITPPKRPRVQDFDPDTSITIVNLPDKFIGDDVSKLFTSYGNIVKKLYTYNTIYMEFETPEIADFVANLQRRPIYQGAYVKIERGVVSKQ